jgi:hypothetical protein
MDAVKCCNCSKPIEVEKTGCYNTPIGIYCCDCYEKGGNKKVTAYYKRQPAFNINSIKI